MKLTSIFKTSATILVLFSFSLPLYGQNQPVRPNIILVMCDDLGWADVGFNGNEEVLTPQLDRLAARGMIFGRFYAASAVCSPTRASCLTGRHPFRTAIPTANSGHLRAQEITLPELLRGAGYTTAHFGKWHLGTLTDKIRDSNRGHPRRYAHYTTPGDHGYDEYFCTEAKVPTYDPMIAPATFAEDKGESLRYGWAAVENAADPREVHAYGTYYWKGRDQLELSNLEGDNSRVIMDRVLPFIQGASARGQPFFATVWFHTPHLPLVTSEKYRKRYASYSHQKQLLYGAISAMDEQVGRLWNTLRELGIDQNTMLWFCSDNGPERDTPGSAGPFRERKRSLYEGGVRVPAFCLWPAAVPPGTYTEVPAVTSDYLPTIVDYLGIRYPDPARPLDGISLRKVLDRQEQQRQAPIGFQFGSKVSWVTDQYKLISTDEGKSFELYDLRKDRSEKQDVAAEHPQMAERMKKALTEWIASCKKSWAGEDY